MTPVRMTRRAAVRALGFAAIGGTLAMSSGPVGIVRAPGIAHAQEQNRDPVFEDLGEQVQQLMQEAGVPGVAVGLRIDGRDHSAGWGITNIEYPQKVDGATVFQIGSTTKTFTGTAVAILRERGQLSLDAPVRQYVPDLALSDAEVAERVTVRHLVTHTAGFFGDVLPNNDRNDAGLARVAQDVASLPQITPPGRAFSYSNMGVSLEGRVVEAVAGAPYRDFVTTLLLQPLGMSRTSFFTEDIVDYMVAAAHVPGPNGLQVQRPVGGGVYSAAVAPVGGLFSTADDLLHWAAFHLGDGRAAHGARVAAPETLTSMQLLLGPGGGIGTEDLEGVGVNWLLRRLNGMRLIEHGGTAPAQRSQFIMVPDRDFAFVLLTNSPGGSDLRTRLTPWVLEHYLGLREPSRPTLPVSADSLAEYAGDFGVPGLGNALEVATSGRGLTMQRFGDDGSKLDPHAYEMHFYAPDRVVLAGGQEEGNLLDFLRSDDGRVSWVRSNGRVFERV